MYWGFMHHGSFTFFHGQSPNIILGEWNVLILKYCLLLLSFFSSFVMNDLHTSSLPILSGTPKEELMLCTPFVSPATIRSPRHEKDIMSVLNKCVKMN